jgi:hypothetical protein
MANKLSAAQAAIKDMQSCKLNTEMFNGVIKATIILNEEVGISNDRVSTKKPKAPKPYVDVHKGYNYKVPDFKLNVKVVIRVINPDGTIGSSLDWDFK